MIPLFPTPFLPIPFHLSTCLYIPSFCSKFLSPLSLSLPPFWLFCVTAVQLSSEQTSPLQWSWERRWLQCRFGHSPLIGPHCYSGQPLSSRSPEGWGLLPPAGPEAPVLGPLLGHLADWHRSPPPDRFVGRSPRVEASQQQGLGQAASECPLQASGAEAGPVAGSAEVGGWINQRDHLIADLWWLRLHWGGVGSVECCVYVPKRQEK